MALGRKKNDPAQFHEKGVNAFEQGKSELARRSFSAAIEIEPTSDRFYNRGLIIDITGNPAEAVNLAQRPRRLNLRFT